MSDPSNTITSSTDLRAHYQPPIERAVLKTLPRIDAHMRRFIALSPFVCVGTSGPDGADVTPRGDAPGFVQVADDTTLLIPDWPGNNRLDSLGNLMSNPQVGLLFFVPGVNETLRVNGVADISVEAALAARWDVGGRRPRSIMRVAVREAFLHCGKALIRSKLWDPSAQVARSELPTYAAMLKDQISVAESADEIDASVQHGYEKGLY
jgi:uncharacterized protein